MTIKVVSGVARGNESVASPTKSQNVQLAQSASAQSPAVHAASNAANSDATVVCLRCSRANAPAERVRDSGQAKDLARDIAERIEREDECFEVHSRLSAADSHQHLTE